MLVHRRLLFGLPEIDRGRKMVTACDDTAKIILSSPCNLNLENTTNIYCIESVTWFFQKVFLLDTR